MCGIVALIGKKYTRQDAENSLRQIKHRGPDDCGIYEEQEANLLLGMTRLSIIDNSGGRQPMVSRCGNYIIVYNGEIFNSVELLKELSSVEINIKSNHSDTEILLESFVKFGRKIIPKLNGMFAFIIYDKVNRVIYGARDRYGIKPLFFSKDEDDGYLFSSEIKVFKKYLPKPLINEESVKEYFIHQRIGENKTIYDNIIQIQPGEEFYLDLKKKVLFQELNTGLRIY